MATPVKPPPNGWKVDGTSGYLSSNSKPIDNFNYVQYSVDTKTGNRIVYAIGPQISTGLTNQVTGQTFDIGGFRKEIMSIDSSGNVTKLKYYEEAKGAIGETGLQTLRDKSKASASTLMSQTGTTDQVKNSSEYKSALANAAPSANTPAGQTKDPENPEGDSETPKPELKPEDVSKAVNEGAEDISRLSPNTYGDTRYPLDRNTKQDYIKFTMYRYSPKQINYGGLSDTQGGDSTGNIFGKRGENRTILGTVSLPIQPTISDTNTVRWGESNMKSFEAEAAGASIGIMMGKTQEVANRAVEGVQNNASALKAYAAGTFAEAAAGGQGGAFFTRLTGGILNPNLELLFEGPQLRNFSFTFSLSARDDKEAKAIKKIIRFFKQGMSVKRAKTSLFLLSPNTFGISYIYGGDGKDHPWINKIKECALQSCVVNYTPAQNYATYEDGAMTQYDLSLTFGELDPIYDDDYKELDGNKDTVIGY